MPEPGEGEPDDVGTPLQSHLPHDLDGGIVGDIPGQRHFDGGIVQEEGLGEDLLPVGRSEVVDVDFRVPSHRFSLSNGSTKTSRIPPQTEPLQERGSSVRSIRTMRGYPVSMTF